jgi:hypothetical protein
MGPIVLDVDAVCRVRLTDFGRRCYREHYTRMGLGRFIPAEIPGEFTLWELMGIFGAHMENGAPDSPFVDNRIEILDPRA